MLTFMKTYGLHNVTTYAKFNVESDCLINKTYCCIETCNRKHVLYKLVRFIW